MPTLNVRLDDEEYTSLAGQAHDDDRSLNAQIKWLIKQESKARPDWQFRPQPQVQEYVEAYAARLGISRSAAINAIVTEHMRETDPPKEP